MKERPNYFYMANLWSEVEKIFIWQERGDKNAMSSASSRALSIIEKIKNSIDKGARAEALILEDVLMDLKSPNRKYLVSRSEMAAYLKPFASRLLAV
jgi:hypothetical protein